MTSRQTGQKISQMYSYQAGYRPRKRKAADQMTGTEKRILAQFLICGTVFVLLVAIKLLLPSRIQWLSQHVNGALERNMDVTEVFSAAGRVFAGKDDDSWKELYRSVFQPEQTEAVPTGAQISGTESETTNLSATQNALNSKNGWLTAPPICDLSKTSPKKDELVNQKEPEPEKENQADEEPKQGGTAQKLSYILYSNKTLPENVTLEQEVLGFDYCTPVMGTLSSDFGYREHPIIGEERFHYGLDIAANEGTDIRCFADGKVTAVGESTSYGKYMMIDHSGGFSTLYAHCSKINKTSGSTVKKGQKIAEVGNTGLSTGPHLHFEVQDGKTYLDPIYYVSLP